MRKAQLKVCIYFLLSALTFSLFISLTNSQAAEYPPVPGESLSAAPIASPTADDSAAKAAADALKAAQDKAAADAKVAADAKAAQDKAVADAAAKVAADAKAAQDKAAAAAAEAAQKIAEANAAAAKAAASANASAAEAAATALANAKADAAKAAADAARFNKTSVKPPVEAPASKQTLASVLISGNASNAPANLWPPRETKSSRTPANFIDVSGFT